MKFELRDIRRINIVVAGTLSAAYIAGKALTVNNARVKLELKKDDKVVPVPPKIRSLIDEVIKDLKIKEKITIKPFMSKGSDIKNIGFPVWSPDIYLGIPEYFMFEEDDKSQFTLVVDEKEIPKTSSEYKPLKESMSLSVEAKKFGIVHEMYESLHSSVIPCGIMPMFVVCFSNSLSAALEWYGKYSKQQIHISNHCMIFLMGAWIYALLYDMFSQYKESDADVRATNLGKSYIQGGVEYYNKMIKRNKLIKKINKDAPYTEEGDVNTDLIRRMHMPLKRRIEYLREISKGEKKPVWKEFRHINPVNFLSNVVVERQGSCSYFDGTEVGDNWVYTRTDKLLTLD